MPTTPTKNLLKNLELLSLGFPECFVCDHMLPKPQATDAFSPFNDDLMKTWGRENHAARIAEGRCNGAEAAAGPGSRSTLRETSDVLLRCPNQTIPPDLEVPLAFRL